MLKLPKSDLNIERSQMPQIHSSKMNDFVEHLRRQNIKVEKKKMLPSRIKPSQSNLNPEKVSAMMTGKIDRSKPLIVSKDNYLLDGHHRWAAELNQKKESPMDVLHVDTHIHDLLKHAHKYSGVSYKSITENIKRIVREKQHERIYSIVA